MIIKIRDKITAKKEWEAHQKQNDPNWLTRRELFEKGLLTTSFTLLAPTVLSVILSKDAKAAGSFRKFVTLDLAGGTGWGPEIAFRRSNGAFLSSYSTHGNPVDPNTNTDTTYGAALWTNALLFQRLQALVAAEPGMAGLIKVCVLQHSNSQDDSGNNRVHITHHAAKLAGMLYNGLRIKTGLSNRNSNSGGNALTIEDLPAFRPSSGNSLTAVQNLLNVAQGEMNNLRTRCPNGPSAIFNLAKAITGGGRPLVESKTEGKQFVDVVSQGLEENKQALNTTIAADPRTDAALQTAFGINAGTGANDPLVVEAANVKALLDGHAAHVIMTEGGYDYHDNTNNWKTVQHVRKIDRALRCLRASFLKNEPMMIYLCTDGGIQYVTGMDLARGDSNERHAGVLIFLHSNGAPAPLRYYLGGYTNGQTAETTGNPLQATPSHEGYAVLASLLHFNGVTDLSPWVPRNMSVSEFASLSVFSPA